MRETVLEVNDLNVWYRSGTGLRKRRYQVLHDVSFTLYRGEILGLVGESGSGKSTLARAVLGMESDVTGTVTHHTKRPQMVFQDPAGSLNPAFTVGRALAEPLYIYGKYDKAGVERRVRDTMALVGLDESYYDRYPHELSGGQKQRVCIGAALIQKPGLIVADEAVSALDVTIQAQVLAMMMELQEKLDTSMIMITHDLGIVAQTCDKVAVMYAGEIIEYGTVEQVFTGDKHHPYTVGLFNSIPNLEADERRLHPIDGMMPDPTDLPQGCYFSPRCPHATERCRQCHPETCDVDGLHIKCFLFDEKEEV